MEWDLKVQMVQLGNKDNNSKEFKDFVLQNIDSFDAQAWDMFANTITLPTKDEVKEDYWKTVYKNIKTVSDGNIGMRASLRLGMIEAIYEEAINENINNTN